MGELARRIRENQRTADQVAAEVRSRFGSDMSLGGFVGNVLGDVKDVASGLGSLVGTIGHDIGSAVVNAADVLPIVDTPEWDYRLDDVAKALPGAIAGDYKRRYGSGAEAFAEGLYEDPLAFLTDVLTVATLGGAGAAKGAQVASRGSKVGRDLETIGRGGDAAADVGLLARGVDKILPGIARGDVFPQGSKQVIDEANRVVPVPRAFNPLKRVVDEKIVDRALSQPISTLEQKAGALKGVLEEGNLDTVGRARTMANIDGLERTISAARGAGLDRVPKTAVGKYRIRRSTDKLFGSTGTHFIRERNQAIAELEDIYRRNSLDPDTVDSFHRIAQWETPESAGRLSFEEIVRRAQAEPTSPAEAEFLDAVSGDLERIMAITDPEELEAATRYIEQLSESVLTPDDAPGAAKALDEVRLWNHRNLTAPMLDKDLLSYKTILDRTYGPGRMAKFGAKWDPDAGTLVGGPSSLELDDMARAVSRKAPIYFPHIDARRLKLSDFLMNWGSNVRNTKPAASKGTMYWLLENDVYLKDPLDAYTRRASQMLKYQETLDLIDKVKVNYGRPIGHADEVSDAEAVFNPEAVRLMFRTKAEIEEATAEHLMAGVPLEDALSDAIQTALPQIEDQVLALLQQQGKQLYAVPKTVADQLHKFAKPRLGGNAARIFWDGPTNVWRSLVLAGSPRWIVNNLLGNTTFLKLQGGRLRDVAKQVYSKRFRDELARIVPEDVAGGFFSSTQQYTPHLGRAAETPIGQITEAAKASAPVRAASRAADRMRQWNSHVEDAFRRASYLKAADRQAAMAGVKKTGRRFISSEARLRRISEAGANPRLVEKAIDEVNYFLNDYNALRPVERNVVRRFAMPFWSFYKHVAKMLTTMPVKHPARFEMLRLLTEVGNDFAEEQGPLPDWLEGAVPIGPGTKPGDTRFLNTRGANPFSAIFQNPLTSIHPVLQGAIEQGTGRDILTGKQFTSPDAVSPFGSDEQYQWNPETGQMEPVTVRPGILEMMLGMVPQVDLYRDLRSPGSRYSGSDDLITQPGTEQPMYPTNPMQDLLKFFGVSTTDFNVPQYQQGLAEDQAAALQELLRRGVTP